MSRPYASQIVILMLSSTLSGCGDPTLVRISSELAQTSNGGPEQVEQYYGHLNEAHRKLVQDEMEIAAQPEFKNITRPPRTGITAEYPTETVEARVKMAQLLSAYSNQIFNISSAKNESSVNQSISSLNSEAQTIAGRLFSLAKTVTALPTAALTTLATPLKTLSQLGLQGAFAVLRVNWAQDALQKISLSFEDVCSHLDSDLTNSTDDVQQRAKHVVTERQLLYDQRVKNGVPESERTKLSSQLMAAGAFSDGVANGNPAKKFRSMKLIMQKLSDWAQKKSATDAKWKFWRKP